MGFDAGDRTNFAQHPDSRTSNIAHIDTRDGNAGRGRWIFRVDQTEIVVGNAHRGFQLFQNKELDNLMNYFSVM